MSGYGEDLSYVHDRGFGDLARAAAPAVIEILLARGITSGLVVELGCGSGITSEQLTGAGYDVLGIDHSAAMIDLARARVPDARFEVASFLDAELPPCVAVTAIGEVFNYLLDARHGPDQLARLFARIHGALEPGGVLIFDLAGPGRIPPAADGSRHQQSHRLADDWAILYEADEDPAARRLERHITTFRRGPGAGESYRRTDEVHHLTLLPASEVAAMLREAGFHARIHRGYGDLQLPGHRVLIASRP
jgi:SAM-dependent methyltransferase